MRRHLTAGFLALALLGAASAPAQAGIVERIVHAARAEVRKHVHEVPDGSNESPDIARYRTATRWSARGPWCGYFVSYVAAVAGAPLGDRGEGLGAVAGIRRWARRAGRWRPSPHAGNIAVFHGHVAVVERVAGRRWLVTIEGNHGNRVARVWRPRSTVRGYVRLVPVAADETWWTPGLAA
jgi:CHAP domain